MGETKRATPEQRIARLKAAIVARMNEVEPCDAHKVPAPGCGACANVMFIARLVDIVTSPDASCRRVEAAR